MSNPEPRYKFRSRHGAAGKLEKYDMPNPEPRHKFRNMTLEKVETYDLPILEPPYNLRKAAVGKVKTYDIIVPKRRYNLRERKIFDKMAKMADVIAHSFISDTNVSKTPNLDTKPKATSSRGPVGRKRTYYTVVPKHRYNPGKGHVRRLRKCIILPKRPCKVSRNLKDASKNGGKDGVKDLLQQGGNPTESLRKRPYVRDSKEPKIKRSRPEYRVLKYVVPRQEYERLDYNATIAHRIYKGLKTEDLHVPDVVKSTDVSFLALVPTAKAFDKLMGDEQMKDVTEDIMQGLELKKQKEQTGTRWISFFPREDTPFQIPEQDETLYLTETAENLKKLSEVKRFLTISFENEIFAYAERASKHVQKQKGKKFGVINLEIRSLLVRKQPQHDTSTFRTSDDEQTDKSKFQFPSSQNIRKGLQNKSLQECGIRGFCNTTDGFLILVDRPQDDTGRTDIANRIEKCLRKYLDDKPEIIWVESVETSNLTLRGDEIINPNPGCFGTLGCFGERNDERNDERLVAITAGHFVKTGEIIQIKETEGTVTEFGRCAESHFEADIDIAVIEVNEDKRSRCDKKFKNENGEDCRASVYQGDELKPWAVHKIGAKTRATSGVVYCGGARVSDEEGIVISGNTDHDVFAERGDSGSIVFFYDPEDIDNRAVKLLSIVSKEIKIKPRGAIPENLTRKPILTRSLRTGLDNVQSITI